LVKKETPDSGACVIGISMIDFLLLDQTNDERENMYQELAEKYLAGDENAIKVINIAVSCAVDLQYIRSPKTDENPWDYSDVRQNIDEAIDDLGKEIQALGLEITQSVIEHEEHNA
jgi:translation initiation factor 2B subunit (eIF-2B alpha/beta/delta family)